MPRRGHHTGPQGCPPELTHYEQRLGIRLRADKLTRAKQQLARSDPAVAAHFRLRIREPARLDAMMAGRTRYESDTACSQCGSRTRTVYAAACWHCAIRRRPLRTDSRGYPTWPKAGRTRAGWLALRDAHRRDRRGEIDTATFGPLTASTTPTGRLSLHAPALGLSIPDLAAIPFDRIHRLARLHPEVLQALEWAGWM